MRTEPLDSDVAGARGTTTGRTAGAQARDDRRSPITRVSRSFAFVDLCGFTDFVDLHGDDAAVAELRILRAGVREAAGAAGVRVDKWLGDGVMLVGVEPEPLVTAVIALRGNHEARGRLPLRGGIATGAVILLDGDDYVGRAVNLAARLCERAESDQILAAADDALALPSGVHATSATSFHVKGFVRPVDVVALARPAGPALGGSALRRQHEREDPGR
jgi:adenylate cyclase